MARDYKSRATPKPKKKQTPGWVWFFTGLLVGLFSSGLIWLKFAPQETDHTVVNRQSSPSPPAQPQKSRETKPRDEKSLPPKPRFDFYTVLPEMEVVVPEPEPEPPQAPKPTAQKPVSPGTAATVTGSGTAYMLQMGSFRRHGDADRMKANLALLGIQAEIQKVVINNQDTYHRVRSGPYHSSQQVNKIRSQLQKNKINSLLIKLKK